MRASKATKQNEELMVKKLALPEFKILSWAADKWK